MDSEHELKALIPRYRVCWSSYPEKAVIDGMVRQVGFRVELYGTYQPEAMRADPAYEVWTALKQVAKSVMPSNHIEALEYEIETFDNAIHYSKMRKNRGDVELHTRIIHKSGFHAADASATDCLREITTNLGMLGASQDYWKKAG